MRKYKWVYFASVIVALITYLMTNKISMLLVLLFLGILLVASLVCWILILKKVSFQIEVSDVSVIGKQLPVNLVMLNKSLLPLGRAVVSISYYNIIFNQKVNQQVILEPGIGKRMEYMLPFKADDCGKTNIKIDKIYLYDILGVFSKNILDSINKDVIINPDVKPIDVKMNSNVSNEHFGEQYDVNRKGQDSSEVFDLRDYRKGDDVRSIHWKLSGKMDKVIIREYGQPTNYQTAIYYDMVIGGEVDEKLKRKQQNSILEMTASISNAMVKANFPHHMLTVDNGKITEKLINDNQSYLQMLSEMMCRRTPADKDEYEYQLRLLSNETRFSKIIYVCGNLTTEYLQGISLAASVTAVYMQNGGQMQTEKKGNNTIIRVPIDYFEEKMKMINI